MAQVAIPSFSFRRRLGLQRRLAFLLLAQEAAASNRRFRGLQAATSTFTTTRTIDPCPSSTTACECAAGEICVWKPYSGGGGVCENVGTKGHIDCFLCAQQEHCATITCPGITTACACAAAAGCAWADAASGCVSSLLSSTSCTACPTQAGCDVDPPQLASYFPQRGGAQGKVFRLFRCVDVSYWIESLAVGGYACIVESGSHSSGSDLRVAAAPTFNFHRTSGTYNLTHPSIAWMPLAIIPFIMRVPLHFPCARSCGSRRMSGGVVAPPYRQA